MFHSFRAKIEQYLNEGYCVEKITKEDRDRANEMKEIYLVLKSKQERDQKPYNANGEPLSLTRDVLEYREEQAKYRNSPFNKNKIIEKHASPIVEQAKREFIQPDVDKEKVLSHRTAKWDKVSKKRASKLTLATSKVSPIKEKLLPEITKAESGKIKVVRKPMES